MDSPSKIRTSAKMCLREICDQAVSMGAGRAKSNASFLRRLVEISLFMFIREKQLISFVLKLLNRDLSTGVGLQMCVELIVLLHAGFAGRACLEYRNRISESAHLSGRGRDCFGSADI